MRAIEIAYAKGHGAHNDFVVLVDPDGRHDLTDLDVTGTCDRRTGIGADGVLRAVRCESDREAVSMATAAEWFMDYRNADGSRGSMCGNGIRVFARHLVDAGLCRPGALAIATRAGVRRLHVPPAGDITVEMGRPGFSTPAAGGDGVKVTTEPGSWPATPVDMGNPHAVVFTDDLARDVDLCSPPAVTPSAAFPHGVTVEFVTVCGPRHLAVRVHERGVGETMACGTGACAAVAAFQRTMGAGEPGLYVVDMPGGRLHVTVDNDGTMRLSGPAVIVARGWWSPRGAPSCPGAPVPPTGLGIP
ncbi:diaminopimelate epimerase [Streptomyces sp. NPDC050095]|uniref:diaminopimelate epimerase n=1 Tax=unclassified Streptomyces TaxID=2593676 RepID=UPI00344A4B03